MNEGPLNQMVMSKTFTPSVPWILQHSGPLGALRSPAQLLRFAAQNEAAEMLVLYSLLQRTVLTCGSVCAIGKPIHGETSDVIYAVEYVLTFWSVPTLITSSILVGRFGVHNLVGEDECNCCHGAVISFQKDHPMTSNDGTKAIDLKTIELSSFCVQVAVPGIPFRASHVFVAARLVSLLPKTGASEGLGGDGRFQVLSLGRCFFARPTMFFFFFFFFFNYYFPLFLLVVTNHSSLWDGSPENKFDIKIDHTFPTAKSIPTI